MHGPAAGRIGGRVEGRYSPGGDAQIGVSLGPLPNQIQQLSYRSCILKFPREDLCGDYCILGTDHELKPTGQIHL